MHKQGINRAQTGTTLCLNPGMCYNFICSGYIKTAGFYGMEEMENSTENSSTENNGADNNGADNNGTGKNSHGLLLIGIAILLLTAIAGVNLVGQKQRSGGTAASSSAEAGAAGESGAAAGNAAGEENGEGAASTADTRPVISPPPGETGSVETEAAPEKDAEVVEQVPGMEKAGGAENGASESGAADGAETGNSAAKADNTADAEKKAAGDSADAAEGSESAETSAEEAADGPGVIVAQDENYGKAVFEPRAVESTEPSRLIASTGIELNGKRLKDDADFAPWYDFDFGKGDTYHDLPGVVTFRGNNWRDDPTYGLAEIRNNEIATAWKKGTGTLTHNGKLWTGSGWTGQPLLMKWPRDVKQHMKMYDSAKEKDDLVEVIYACMDGKVYFLDLVTGEATRDPLDLGFTFKGAGALDPRGYPILYVGAGYDSGKGRARVFIVNLLDLSVMHTFGNQDPFSLRGNLSYFDSSPLVDADSDTLIYPGENGILYLIQLNTKYDRAAGTLSIAPGNTAKWHYSGKRTRSGAYWVGMEDSAAVYGHYLFIADNGGNLMCLDLQTLKLVWVQDILDDSNSTPVLSEENGKLYLYVSTSFHLGWRSSGKATVPVWKINAETGEIVWQHDYECSSESGVSGGVQSTIAVGKNGLSDYIYVTVSKTGGLGNGVLDCLDKKTGETVWEHKASYAWSSPVCVYNSDGSGRVFYAASAGKMYLLDGKTGEQLSTVSINDGTIEASPAVYENRVVIGTRGQSIRGLLLK